MPKNQFTSASLPSSSSIKPLPTTTLPHVILQGLIEIYASPQIASDPIVQDGVDSGDTEQALKQQIYLAIENFQETPNEETQSHLITILKRELDRVEKQYEEAIHKRDIYQQAAKTPETKPSGRFFSQWQHSMTHGIKNFFGSTDVQQAEKYQAIADQRWQHRTTLEEYIVKLEGLDFATIAEQESNPTLVTAPPLEEPPEIKARLTPLPTTTPFPAIISLSTLESKTGFAIDAESPGDGIGSAISSGDVDGDGFNDILLGAPNRSDSMGSVYLVRGSVEMGASGPIPLTPSSQVIRMDGETPDQQTGSSVRVVGDLRGQGGSDILIGGPGYYGYTGRSYLVYGGASLTQNNTLPLSSLEGTTGVKIDGESFDDFSGQSVGVAKDIDDQLQLLVGSIGYSSGGSSAAGRGYAVSGRALNNKKSPLPLASLDGSNGYKIDFNTTNAQLGWSITGIGDFNYDGYEDIAISAPYANNSTGIIFLVYGNPEIGFNGDIALESLDGHNGTRLDGENPGDFAGWSVSSIQQAGQPSNLLIGAPVYGGVGRTYVLQGNKSYGRQFSLNNLTPNLGSMVDGENLGDSAGYSVASIGHLAGDNSLYFAIGAPGYAQSRGRTYVVRYDTHLDFRFNLSTLQGSNGFIVEGENPYDFSGSSVADGGDIQNRQAGSLVIGAPRYKQSSGRAYVIHGIPSVSSGSSADRNLLWTLSLFALFPIGGLCIYCYYRHKKSAEENPINNRLRRDEPTIQELHGGEISSMSKYLDRMGLLKARREEYPPSSTVYTGLLEEKESKCNIS